MYIGRYQIIDEIGAGGMGRVRLARDPSGRLVVLKTALRNDVDDDERLRDEARVGLRLKHPSLVETLDLFEAEDVKAGRERPVLVTAYVPGVSLIDLRRVGPVHPVVVCRLGRQLAEALDAIHDAKDLDGRLLGVLHRDVTAGNCLVGHDGRARLIDLGISRSAESRALRTETGLLRGTLRYLAPELFDGGPYSAQSDLWALGVVLWEALLGRPAVSGSDAVAVGRICSGSMMILDKGEEPDGRVCRAIAQLLRRDPAERPRRAREAAALFAMLEKALPGDADELAQAVVWRAIGGPDVEGETSLQGHGMLGLGDDETMSETGPVAHLPITMAEMPAPTDPFIEKKTPSESIADYAASLLSMEKALAAAWNKADLDRATLALLPVVTGVAVAVDEQTACDVAFGGADRSVPRPALRPAEANPRTEKYPLPAGGSFFPEILPLPPWSSVVMPVGHDAIATPIARPGLALLAPVNDNAAVPLLRRRQPMILGGVLLLLVVLVAFLALLVLRPQPAELKAPLPIGAKAKL